MRIQNGYRLQFKAYERNFRRPFVTAAGIWKKRAGVVVRLEDADGRCGYGEVAPLSSFGTETVRESLTYLSEMGIGIHSGKYRQVPETLPCTAVALAQAERMLRHGVTAGRVQNTALLSLDMLGPCSQAEWYDLGFRSFKLKIGVGDVVQEILQIQDALVDFPADVRLRLDANGALKAEDLCFWLDAFSTDDRIEFIEQPLRTDIAISSYAQLLTPHGQAKVALDESIANMHSLRQVLQQGWEGPGVIKTALLGNPDGIEDVLSPEPERWVLSSAFETVFGMLALVDLALRVGLTRPVGCGTLAWFDDGLGGFAFGPYLRTQDWSLERLDLIWKALSPT